MKYWSNLLALILMLSMGACSSEDCVSEELGLNSDAEITEISAVIDELQYEGGSSRTAVTMGDFNNNTIKLVWADQDTIGIYPTEGDQLSFPIVEGVGTTTCVFNGGGWALKTSSSYKAYTPFNRSYYYKKTDNLPVSMLGQKQVGNGNSSHLGRYDLQIANGNTPASGKITFDFKRQVCFIRMDLTAPVAATWKSITLESNAAFTTKASLDLSSSTYVLTPTATSNSVTLDLENVTTKSGEVITAYMAVLPIDLTGKTLDVILKDSDDNLYKKTAVIAHDYRNFKANYSRWIKAEFEEGVAPTIPYVTFTADAPQTLTMGMAVDNLEYSVNGGEWTILGTTPVAFGGSNGNLRLRGNNDYGTNGAGIIFGNVTPVACTGDIRTLIDYEEYKTVYTGNATFHHLFNGGSQLISAPALPATTLADECYYAMFSGCSSLTVAPDLPAITLPERCYVSMFSYCTSLVSVPALPATTLTSRCYSYMFDGCTSLTSAPALPATTLADNCYCNMFSGCTSLSEAPDLPAKLLASGCYSSMFSGCTSLTEAPALPATTLADNCYSNMFSGCTSLTEAPALPATILADYCYNYMFSGCTSLTEAPALPAKLLASGCYCSTFSGCTSLTEAPALPAKLLASRCYISMFSGCTSLTSAPSLPATELAEYCYADMFQGCTSLTSAPSLPATTLAKSCYSHMFQGCTSLISAPDLPAKIMAYRCYYCMFACCSNLINAPKLPSTTLAEYCYAGMFTHCTSLSSPPELPATTLAEGCYGLGYYDSTRGGMFSWCESLTSAPVLHATILVDGCYSNMFRACTKLNSVTMLATDISASDCLTQWLASVSSTGTFTKAAEMTTLPTGSSGIPSGWTVVDYEEK